METDRNYNGYVSVPRLMLIYDEPQLSGLLLFPEGGRLRFDCVLLSITEILLSCMSRF